MMERDLSLKKRIEAHESPRSVSVPVQFELKDIKNHFDQSLNKIMNQYDVADSLERSGQTDDCRNIWRAQIVFLEGILDFYLHEMSKYCLYKMFRGEWEKSEKYHSLQVPILIVEEGIALSESKEWFFDYLNKRFSRDVFLSSESMREQLNLMGLGFSEVMHEAFKKKTINESNKYGAIVIQTLFQRRNAITHQLDRDHFNAVQKDITKEYVEDRTLEVVKVVEAIHKKAIEKG